MNMPTLYILCGLPGSGKTTYAKELEKKGIRRLSLDEELFKTYGKDFPPEKYSEFERAIKNFLLNQAAACLQQGVSVSLDWGFWKKADRDDIRSFAVENSAQSKLVYFKKDFEDLVSGISNRDMTSNHSIDSDMLEKFQREFEEPSDEGEEVVDIKKK